MQRVEQPSNHFGKAKISLEITKCLKVVCVRLIWVARNGEIFSIQGHTMVFQKVFDLFLHDINHIEANKLIRHFRLIEISLLLESTNWEAGRIH
jgi:hypothetical protein